MAATPEPAEEDGVSGWDVIVIGGGTAGTSAARAASIAGARTLLVNDGELGGLCILRGCMPTKAMLASADAAHAAAAGERLGVRFEGRVSPDFAAVMRRKDALVARFQRAKIASVEAQDYAVRFGRARFVPGGGVEIDGEPVPAEAVVVATGSVPVFLPLPGIEAATVWTSDDVMRLERRPDRLVVQGAGSVGLELAQFFARLGTEVTLVSRSPLLWRFDSEAGEELARALAREPNLTLAAPGTVTAIRGGRERAVVTVRRGDEILERPADALLMAAGRRPAIDGLGLEHAGVRVDPGGIPHDEEMRTTNRSVLVAGDVTGRYQILHLAHQEGAVAGHNAAGRAPARRMDYRLRMHVVFTDPPFAQVGLGEREARECGVRHVSATARFPETGRAITMGVEHGLWKMLADPRDGEILGSTIVGPRADDLVHVVSTMMAYRGTSAHIAGMPWYHPTLSEVMLDLFRGLEARRTPGGAATGGAGVEQA